MLLSSFILAISSSIDSLGIGITYGIKNIKISCFGKIILFAISFLVSSFSICFGNFLITIFPSFLSRFIGSFILIIMGIFIIFHAIKGDPQSSLPFDFDSSQSIDSRESLFLALALSFDSFGICIGGSIIGMNITLFPFLIGAFQLCFMSLGNFIGRKLHQFTHFPNNLWSLFSGILLALIGFLKFFF